MAIRDNFYEIKPNDRRAFVVYAQLNRVMEAENDEEYFKRATKLKAMLEDGIGKDRAKEFSKVDNSGKNNLKAGNDLVKIIVRVLNDMKLSEGEISYTLDYEDE